MLTNKMKQIGVKGFSLVELMVVVAIIGILAAVAIPNFQRFQRKARQSEGKAALSAISASEAVFFDEWQIYHASLLEIGHTPPQGDMIYNAGFAAPAVTDPSTRPNYPRTAAQVAANAGIFNNFLLCPALGAGAVCSISPAVGGAGTAGRGGAMPATVEAANAFTAGAHAFVGGLAADQWTIDQNRSLRNVTDGTL
jgi:type IV pilus assembly protein PilA